MEKYTFEQQAKAFEIAAKKCGLDSHISYLDSKNKCYTWADKIIGRFFRKGMPIKRSFLYCDTLDISFHFLANGQAVYTYAGYADCRDATENKIVNAFRIANKMRVEMELALQAMQEGEDGK